MDELDERGSGHYFKIFLAVFFGIVFSSLFLWALSVWFFVSATDQLLRDTNEEMQKISVVSKQRTEEVQKLARERSIKAQEENRLQAIEGRKKTVTAKKLKQRCSEWSFAASENENNFANEQKSKFCTAYNDFIYRGKYPRFQVR